ncbi:MAG: hypothetical protein AAF705_08345 [Bacteroidota bacterium]
MKFLLTVAFFLLLLCSSVQAQTIDTKWYSATANNGIIIQNSYPKGGRYLGSTNGNYHHSYLVFYTRVSNETEQPLALNLSFSGDAIPIPNSPDTYVKLFLPQDTMTLAKQDLFSYGLTELASLEESTEFKRTLSHKEDCLLYVVAVFYQTCDDDWNHERGGNRAELVLKGQDLFYNMLPQVDGLACGRIVFNE